MLRCADIIKSRENRRSKNSLAPVKKGTRSQAQWGLSVCRSPSQQCQRMENKKARLLVLFPPALQLSLRMALNFEGEPHWPKNRVAVFPLGQRQQLYEHESPGETALLTSYLLGSSEGGTNSPFNLTSHPYLPLSLFFFTLCYGYKICGYSLFLEHSAGVDNVVLLQLFSSSKRKDKVPILMASE